MLWVLARCAEHPPDHVIHVSDLVREKVQGGVNVGVAKASLSRTLGRLLKRDLVDCHYRSTRLYTAAKDEWEMRLAGDLANLKMSYEQSRQMGKAWGCAPETLDQYEARIKALVKLGFAQFNARTRRMNRATIVRLKHPVN